MSMSEDGLACLGVCKSAEQEQGRCEGAGEWVKPRHLVGLCSLRYR